MQYYKKYLTVLNRFCHSDDDTTVLFFRHVTAGVWRHQETGSESGTDYLRLPADEDRE